MTRPNTDRQKTIKNDEIILAETTHEENLTESEHFLRFSSIDHEEIGVQPYVVDIMETDNSRNRIFHELERRRSSDGSRFGCR